MRKRVYAALAAGVILAGVGVGAVAVRDNSSAVCEPPRMLLDSHRNLVLTEIDNHLERYLLDGVGVISPPYKASVLAEVDWELVDAPVQRPGRIVVTILVGEQWTFLGPLKGAAYQVVLTRACRGGGWVIESFSQPAGGKPGPASKS